MNLRAAYTRRLRNNNRSGSSLPTRYSVPLDEFRPEQTLLADAMSFHLPERHEIGINGARIDGRGRFVNDDSSGTLATRIFNLAPFRMEAHDVKWEFIEEH